MEAQAASGATLKADSKEESKGTTVKIRKFPSGGEDKPALVLSLQCLDGPGQGAIRESFLGRAGHRRGGKAPRGTLPAGPQALCTVLSKIQPLVQNQKESFLNI